MIKLLIAAFLIVPVLASAKASNASSVGGRYQVVQLSDMRSDQVLIDSQTGQTWHHECYVKGSDSSASACEYLVWVKDDAQDINKSYKQLLQTAAGIKKLMESPEPAK